MNDKVTLNIAYLKQRLSELDLKKMAVAAAIGVDRNTLQRWLSGYTTKIRRHNLIALAKELGCDTTSLQAESHLQEKLGSRGLTVTTNLLVEGRLRRSLASSGGCGSRLATTPAFLRPRGICR